MGNTITELMIIMIIKKKKGAIESSKDERMGNAATASLGISATANLRPEEPKSRTTPDALESSSLQTWCHDKDPYYGKVIADHY